MVDNADKANLLFRKAHDKFANEPSTKPTPSAGISSPAVGGLGVIKLPPKRPSENILEQSPVSQSNVVSKRSVANLLPEDANNFDEQVEIVFKTISGQLLESTNPVSLYKFINEWIDAIVDPDEHRLNDDFNSYLSTMKEDALKKFISVLLIGLS